MAVAIRLTRVGATKRPAYRVIAIDKRRSRDGRALEILGYYDPLTEPATVQLDTDKIKSWIGKGAQPSETVVKLMRQAEKTAASGAPADKPKRATRPTKPKASSKAAARAAKETSADEASATPQMADPAAASETGAETTSASAEPNDGQPEATAEADPAEAEKADA